MRRIVFALGVALLLADCVSAQAQTYCAQVRQAVATYGYAAARRHALAQYGIQAVRVAERCLVRRGHRSRR
jgi:hypothetical protein